MNKMNYMKLVLKVMKKNKEKKIMIYQMKIMIVL